MFKKFIILMIFIISPVFAGEFEDASKVYSKVFLYLYSPKCIYCVKFDPQYEILSKKYTNCKFIKIDVNSKYGTLLMRKFNAYYVPYIALVDNKNKTLQNISPSCIVDNACIKDQMNKFVK